jgi:hypothetical protein
MDWSAMPNRIDNNATLPEHALQVSAKKTGRRYDADRSWVPSGPIFELSGRSVSLDGCRREHGYLGRLLRIHRQHSRVSGTAR